MPVSFGEILWPPRCFFCDEVMKAGEGPVCASCREKGLAEGKTRTRRGEFYASARAPFSYRDEAAEAVVRLKRPDGAYLLKPAADFIAGACEEEKEEYALATWIPLDLKRRLARGFNRSEELARLVAARRLKGLVTTIGTFTGPPNDVTPICVSLRLAVMLPEALSLRAPSSM